MSQNQNHILLFFSRVVCPARFALNVGIVYITAISFFWTSLVRVLRFLDGTVMFDIFMLLVMFDGFVRLGRSHGHGARDGGGDWNW